MRLSRRENYEAHRRHHAESVETDQEGFFKMLCGRELNPTQKSFIFDEPDPENFPRDIRGFYGAARAGKTTAAFALMLSTASVVPGFRIAIGRYDYNKLEKMNIPDLEQMLGRVPRHLLLDRSKSAPMVWTIANGGEPSTIMFLNLKEYPGGSQFNWIHVEEAAELPDGGVVDALWSRLSAPDPYGMGRRLTMTFNPPTKVHWLYPACTGRDARDRPYRDPETRQHRPAWIRTYQPRYKENAHNLPHGYYEEMERSKGMSQQERMSKLIGEFGTTFEGDPVYPEFRKDLHVRDARYDPSLPLVGLWDFGYNTPVCLFAQCDDRGQLRIIGEEIGEKVRAKPFGLRCKTVAVQKWQAQIRLHFGDPAVRQEKDTGSTLAELAEIGIQMLYEPGISIDRGVKCVRERLEMLVQGEPAFVISPDCVMTIEALKGGYRLGKTLSKTGEQDPVKDGVYDHPMDALRYGVWGFFGGGRRFNPNAFKGQSTGDFPDSLEYNPAHD